MSGTVYTSHGGEAPRIPAKKGRTDPQGISRKHTGSETEALRTMWPKYEGE
jgi:hypothetical protein